VSLEAAVGRSLAVRRQTLSLAESCTGGLVAERITRVPGSSAYFIEARVVYANEAKVRLLGVPRKVLAKDGAVSSACALAMARGLKRRSGTHWALSVTGVAGPGGGSKDKPVGLVYIALAGPRGVRVWEHRFRGGREGVRRASAKAALGHLREALLE
jgi:nicotinamide-nucleotide amidase